MAVLSALFVRSDMMFLTQTCWVSVWGISGAKGKLHLLFFFNSCDPSLFE